MTPAKPFDGVDRFYHATSVNDIDAISKNGLKKKTCLTSSESMVMYYAETIEDEGLGSVVIVVNGGDLAADQFDIDFASIEEPITTVLHCKEDEVLQKWLTSDQTAKACLEITTCVRHKSVIPANLLSVMLPNGAIISLQSYIEAMDANRNTFSEESFEGPAV